MFVLLINVKMATIVGILTFMSRIKFLFSRDEHEKSFITSGPDPLDVDLTVVSCTCSLFTYVIKDTWIGSCHFGTDRTGIRR